MKLYVVRHGESENNVKGWWTGWQNPNLTEKGVEDAKRAGSYFADVTVDKVYASDLKRAVCTAKTALPGREIETTELLREVNLGKLAGRAIAQCDAEYGEVLQQHKKEVNYVPYGGENAAQFEARLSEFLRRVEACGCETVAAFAHAGVLRRMWKIVTGTPFDFKRVLCRNCAVLILEYTDGIWKVHSWMNL